MGEKGNLLGRAHTSQSQRRLFFNSACCVFPYKTSFEEAVTQPSKFKRHCPVNER